MFRIKLLKYLSRYHIADGTALSTHVEVNLPHRYCSNKPSNEPHLTPNQSLVPNKKAHRNFNKKNSSQIAAASIQDPYNRTRTINGTPIQDPYKRTRNISDTSIQNSHERTVVSEKEFLVTLKHDPDKFGTDDNETSIDEGDLEEERYFSEQPLPSQKLRTKQYADMIKALLSKRKIKEAIDLVEIRMIKEDRVAPENYIFNLILGACGRVGYSKKAFSIYNDMKKRGLKITGGTYTALFNACANSPWKEDGLTRAKHLREIMIEKMYEPNVTNYNAMIKAFGRCGDLQTAFELVDEMVSKKLPTNTETMNFLIQACASDNEAGFRHALLVWHKMVVKRIKPSVHTYNLILRCVRDCGMGDLNQTRKVLEDLLGETVPIQIASSSNSIVTNEISDLEKPHSDNESGIEYTSRAQNNETMGDVSTLDTVSSSKPIINENKEISIREKGVVIRPDLLALKPHLGSIISISEIKKPEDRLLLVGGMTTFLDNMKENECDPDIKTYTQLLDCIPGTIAAEEELMNRMKMDKVRPDVDFYNMLIKKRSMRFDYESAKDVLIFFNKARLKPNLVTYGVLALGCKTKEEADDLLFEMKNKKYRINIEILGAMLHQACHHNNIKYVLSIMELCVDEAINPNKVFMERLENFKYKLKNVSNDKRNKIFYSKVFREQHLQFRNRYKSWVNQVQVEEEPHPWQQFRETYDTDVRHYEDKESDSRFKPVNKSPFVFTPPSVKRKMKALANK